MEHRINANAEEIRKFSDAASRWWDPESEFQPLHAINPLRLEYIQRHVPLTGQTVLDVGCGGGILSEAMAHQGGRVTGIDLGRESLDVASLHALETEADVSYREIAVEALADEMPGAFDVVTCMEMLEHVPDPVSTVMACAELAQAGGDLFFSTINRSPLSWAAAIAGAEYVLGLLPRGTHRYDRLIRPEELARACRNAGLDVLDISGMDYNPFSHTVHVGSRPRVNYLLHARKPE